ncbi:PQQ-dependent dehydrogenase, methanol/ethanol family [Croceicoccus sp. YJ47]|uniref:PQQ-dependent dehydrogenase, methanol/ethanol family n=1 Tax=Croceicoccus sp. YJ47 TaxID=2798724 RepID=UPI0019247496|nr:PQQ-dependent dehydrogenase, methanol/ethanol family [Croceicoccus sp. YJ47]QQN75125.1 PQQ-dependent dehydrogenase, methanol/ethanol family [Croceicoccus sp. YJ47]
MKARAYWLWLAPLLLSACGGGDGAGTGGDGEVRANAILADDSGGDDWPAFGRTYGEQHYSPLTQIDTGNVAQLGLAWSMDLPPGNPATGPIAVDGVIYMATGYSIVRAIDARNGKQLWSFDPKAPQASGKKLRQGWGSRGIAWWNGKVITATQDGRLVALDAKTGAVSWSSRTFPQSDSRFISGPPRVFDGKVVIGHGGADSGPIRGYVTAYDADTGEQLWRFYTVPGNPADGFESEAMEMAARTWSGEWWKYGGGGNVWNAITYDAEQDLVLLGTGNGAPWNHKIRSDGEGDNLFLCSIVAVDAKTGEYRWHYQINPGESWDFNASMDMELADLTIDGRQRKVVMTAPKNGFFYVIDRTNGELISAEPFVTVTWAKGIDKATGRPIEAENVRYEDGPVTFQPTPVGAHSWLPMAYSPQSGLAYIPTLDLEVTYDDTGITKENFEWVEGMGLASGVGYAVSIPEGAETTGYLTAYDPVAQKPAWRIPMDVPFSGGAMATAGGLVFQGRVNDDFVAYDAKSGKVLWTFDAKAPVIAPPITYTADGVQYVTVIAGIGTSPGLFGPMTAKFGIDYRTQARRVLTFRIGAAGTLPAKQPYTAVAFADPDYRADARLETAGEGIFNARCAVCHGGAVIAGGTAPDLRTSAAVADPATFHQIVRGGALVHNGMPQFQELSDRELRALRQYIRARAADLRKDGGA